MNAIADSDAVYTPREDIGRYDHELLHPDAEAKARPAYARLSGRAIASPAELVEGFLAYHRSRSTAWAGFKSMPNRHPRWADFAGRDDIKFITVIRRDIASTAASFHLARQSGTWRRSGGHQPYRWRFVSEDKRMVTENVLYLYQAHRHLERLQPAIHLCYENLCQHGFRCAALDEYFERPIRLADPKPPISGASYIENWPEFEAFVHKMWKQIDDRVREATASASGAR